MSMHLIIPLTIKIFVFHNSIIIIIIIIIILHHMKNIISPKSHPKTRRTG